MRFHSLAYVVFPPVVFQYMGFLTAKVRVNLSVFLWMRLYTHKEGSMVKNDWKEEKLLMYGMVEVGRKRNTDI